MKEIDHEPFERHPTNRIWWVALAIVAILWGLTLFGAKPIDWDNTLLGIGTGVLLALWAIEITGNKVPESWRRKGRN